MAAASVLPQQAQIVHTNLSFQQLHSNPSSIQNNSTLCLQFKTSSSILRSSDIPALRSPLSADLHPFHPIFDIHRYSPISSDISTAAAPSSSDISRLQPDSSEQFDCRVFCCIVCRIFHTTRFVASARSPQALLADLIP